MAFPTKLLNDGEEVVLDLHPHWWYLTPAVTLVVAAVVATVISGSTTLTWLTYLLAAVLVLAVVWLLVRYARWATTSLVLTNHRLVHRSGILGKNGREIPLDHINDISYHQRIFERLIGAGDVIIESAGQRGQEVFADLPKPGRIQNEIYRQIDAGKRRRDDDGGGGHDLSIPEQIDKLDQLCRRGVITRAEFDAKKTQLLDRL
ncbi:MAG TPA: PH domain-containing protein [Acidimicrobiales bacterium]|nr:PH domain-containing protein [Acidimicrobiales bacterium]